MQRRSRRMNIALVALALAAAPALASCGDDPIAAGDEVASIDDGSAPASTTAPDEPEADLDPQEAMLAYTDCMREQGVDMPDPQIVVSDEGGAGKGGVISRQRPGEPGEGPAFDPQAEEFQAADRECRHFIEDAMGDIEIDPEQLAEQQAKMLEHAQCMRDNGVAGFPDPRFGENGSVMVTLDPSIDASSEEFQQAQEVCSDLIFDGEGPIRAGSRVGGAVMQSAGAK